MLYYVFDWLDTTYDIPGAGVFRFLSFRAAMAVITSLVITLFLGKRIIGQLLRLQVGETIRLPSGVSFSSAGQQSSVTPEDIGLPQQAREGGRARVEPVGHAALVILRRRREVLMHGIPRRVIARHHRDGWHRS